MNKSNIKWLAVIDPIPFRGGSKVASAALLEQLESRDVKVEVYTRNPEFWVSTPYITHALYEIKALESAEQGIPYFLKHALLSLQIILRLWLRKRASALVGISGPGVDLSVYWSAKILRTDAFQLVHGPVANSRTIRKNFSRAKLVACLQSELESVKPIFVGDQAAREFKFMPMLNGIPDAVWPAKSHNRFVTPSLFWAASLLKWKGLDLFLSAEVALRREKPATKTVICYIQPTGTQQAMSRLPSAYENRAVYENPTHLNLLRAGCNIFVSTSHSEPFGLSILEALAAGLCVVIPSDGAYWDKQLEHNINCIKYRPNDSDDLTQALRDLTNNMAHAQAIAARGQIVAERYHASTQYRAIVQRIHNLIHPLASNA